MDEGRERERGGRGGGGRETEREIKRGRGIERERGGERGGGGDREGQTFLHSLEWEPQKGKVSYTFQVILRFFFFGLPR